MKKADECKKTDECEGLAGLFWSKQWRRRHSSSHPRKA